MKLKPHQIKAVKETPDKHGLFFECRAGKTPTAIRLACERAETAIIICPKSLEDHWRREVKIWKKGDCNISVMSRDRFKRDWIKLPFIEAVICDECHGHFSNYKNQAYKALDNYIRRWYVRFIWLLTGTPKPASSWSIYSYGKLFGKDWDWYAWDQRFFYRVKMGNRRIPMPKANMDKELMAILKSIGTVISLKDVAEVPEDEDIIENFTLNKEQKKLIEDYFDPLPIVRYTREHQLEQGTLKNDGYREAISISCEKDKRLLELVEGNDKVVIVCRYHDQIAKYKEILKKTKRNIYVISGQEKKTASEIAPEAEKDPTAIVIIQSDTVAGYSLKSFNTMIFASMSFSFVNYEQCKFRIKAMEKKEPCQYIHMITEGKSIDRAVYDCVIKKQDFNINLFNK